MKDERPGTVNGQEHLGTIESERSYALERKVENGHVHAPKTKELPYLYENITVFIGDFNFDSSDLLP